jgi:hypothetical protein
MPSHQSICVLSGALVAALLSAGSFADTDDRHRGHRGPPPESFAACTALIEGDSCTFTGRRDDELTGTCRLPQDDELACVPAQHGKRGGHDRSERPADDDSSNADSAG